MTFISLGAFGQWSYNVNSSTDAGNPGGVNGDNENIGTAGWTTIQTGSQTTNSWSANQTIPFAFDFFGSPVTQFKASLNGLVTFDVASAVAPTSVNDDLPSANLPDSTICGFWDEFTNIPPTGNNDVVVTRVYGTAPNRQFWIKWYSFEMGNPFNSYVYISVVLEETTNNIYVVDQFSSGNSSSTTVGVQLDAATAIQFGNNTLNLASNVSGSITDNDYYTFAPEFLVSNNAGVLSLDNPTLPLSAGLQNVGVTVQNYGNNDLSAFNIEWEVDGILQTPFTYTGGIISAGTPSVSLNLGSYNFVNDLTNIKLWTDLPNGVADNLPANDTLEVNACMTLAGTYSIGGTTPDFATITGAVNALNSCGISGPVVFNISPGTYMEQITLIEVIGASAVNTIVFDGGDASTTAVTSDASIYQWATIGHDGADHVTWKNLTVASTATTDGAGFGYWNDATFNLVDSCNIVLDDSTLGVQDLVGIMVSGSATSDFSEGLGNGYNTFSNNTILGGEMAFHLEGDGAFLNWTKGITIANNHGTFMDDFGIYVDNMDTITIIGNYFAETKSTVADGIFCRDIANFNISENEIYADDYGIYIADGNFAGPVVGQSSLINNMVKSDADYAIYLDDINNVNIWHNTAWGNPGIRLNDFTNLNIQNNIFRSSGDYAFESDETVASQTVDYNVYWTPASNTLYAKDGPATYPDLALWQAGSPALNVSSIEIEPNFVAALDLRRFGPNGNDSGNNALGVLVDIDGDARPVGPSVDMGADEYTPVEEDAELIEILPFGTVCGDSASSVFAVVTNNGANDITSLAIEVNTTGAVSTTFNLNYTNTIVFGQIDTVLVGTINVYAGGLVNFDGSVTLAGDPFATNDSTIGSVNFIPAEPVGFGAYGCGADTAVLTGLGGYPVSYSWYDSPVGGNLMGVGSSYTVPSISTQDTYYLQYSQSPDSLQTTLAAGSSCGGGNMFDLISANGTYLSQIAVHSYEGVGTNVAVNVYYITDNTYVGNETNPAAWTAAGSYVVTSGGTGNLTSYLQLVTPIALIPGQSVAIYVEYEELYTDGTTTFTNGDVQLFTGAGLCNTFESPIQGRMFNGELVFEHGVCSNIRTPVTAIGTPGVMVDLGADTAVCDVQYILDAGNNDPQTTWAWSDTLATDQTYTVSSPGQYYVTVTDSAGCVGMDTVNVELSGLTLNSSPLADTACVGDTIAITASISNFYPYSFTWSNGDTTEVIQVTTTGNYQITVVDSIGCSDSLTSIIDFISAPAAGFAGSLNSVDLIVNSTATDADSTVYDFGDGTIATGTDLTHTYTVNGNYQVCQYVFNDCGSDTVCEQIDITQVSLDEISSSIALKPNPAQTQIEISIDGFEIENITILTTDGRFVYKGAMENNVAKVDVSQFPSGVYFVRVDGPSGQGTRRFVKN